MPESRGQPGREREEQAQAAQVEGEEEAKRPEEEPLDPEQGEGRLPEGAGALSQLLRVEEGPQGVATVVGGTDATFAEPRLQDVCPHQEAGREGSGGCLKSQERFFHMLS